MQKYMWLNMLVGEEGGSYVHAIGTTFDDRDEALNKMQEWKDHREQFYPTAVRVYDGYTLHRVEISEPVG